MLFCKAASEMFVLFLYCFVRHVERFDSFHQLGPPLPDDHAEALGALPVALVVARDLENAMFSNAIMI